MRLATSPKRVETGCSFARSRQCYWRLYAKAHAGAARPCCRNGAKSWRVKTPGLAARGRAVQRTRPRAAPPRPRPPAPRPPCVVWQTTSVAPHVANKRSAGGRSAFTIFATATFLNMGAFLSISGRRMYLNATRVRQVEAVGQACEQRGASTASASAAGAQPAHTLSCCRG